MANLRIFGSKGLRGLRVGLALVALGFCAGVEVFAQGNDQLTPRQRRIEQQKQRLTSGEVEERRDALMKLGGMKNADASRAAVAGINDSDPMVRVTAAHAITSLPASEATTLLLPLLKDKLEFVRREAAYAIGQTRSRSAVQPLVDLLGTEKEVSVRTAATVALGQIRDEAAVPALANLLSGVSSNKKSKKREDDFVMRSAAQALGEIRSRAGVLSLTAALTNETNSLDVRRAAAEALGLIGDSSATSALESATASNDPYLSEAARAALRRLRLAKK
jgi:HEAT repeat protein